ncbi:MAG: aminoacetone oxidase family FAD-binding enzyme [Vicinamibacterales bacterium]
MSSVVNVRVAVVGAGAAGLVASIFAASRGADVLLIERTADGGKKILISGGGRCNILPSALAPERFVTGSPAHLMRGMLRSWPLVAQQEFFENEVGIPLALEEESGKLFPRSNQARDVRDGLLALARSRGVRVQFDTSVTGLEPSAGAWTIKTDQGDIAADRVVLATGGLSVPLTGSDGFGLRAAQSLGHRMIDTYPALTPLLAGEGWHAVLSGVSLNVRLRGRTGGGNPSGLPGKIETSGGFLFTHRGYSGPAVLDISHLATTDPGAVIRAQWSPLDAARWTKEFAAPSSSVLSIVSRHVPSRLAEQLMAEAAVHHTRRTSDFRRTERTALVERLTSYVLPWTGDEGYKKAEVTGGGVALDEVDPRTLESRRCPGLFLCGEMLDAFGPIGGHNFAWAWSTGRSAGLAASRK